MTPRWFALLFGCCLALLLDARPGYCWVFPEHVEITHRAVRELETQGTAKQKAVLAMVKEALHLCDEEFSNRCATLASLVALAGDHSCTPAALRATLAAASKDHRHWVWGVLEVSASTRSKLTKEADRDAAQREDFRRQMHVGLQLTDPEYLARALLDYSHFQPTRGLGTLDLERFLKAALAGGAGANATASYVNYHVVALRLAARARRTAPLLEKRAWLARAVTAEAFALHFLEDSFSAGHFVGHWGGDAMRLGTHDHYSRVGLEAATWLKPTETFIAHGDAFLSFAEGDVVAAAVRASLVQVMDAATDEATSQSLLTGVRDGLGEEAYDSCGNDEVPAGLSALSHSKDLQEIIALEPIPAAGFPALARVRAEKGFFVGGAATAAATYAAPVPASGLEIRATVRAGVGAAGIVDDPLNAQAFVEAGFVGQYLPAESNPGDVSLTGYSFRVRAPGYVCLVDGIFALTLAQLFQGRCPFCLRWGVAAAGGGLGDVWKSHPLFGSVAWQISVLRDVSLNWFRNYPSEGQSRWEVMFSAFTARSVLPIVGERWSQSTDFYLDVGPALIFESGQPTSYGAFASFAMATRVFP